ncbi:MAG: HpcH/HpaI aldolase/citrate lyase family protein [Propionibacteriaceae bacterium]
MNLTWLYAPAHSKYATKALQGHADVVILDLEDSVAPEHKSRARGRLSELVHDADREISVRVNPPDTPWHRDDLLALADMPAGVSARIPKIRSARAVEEVAQQLPGRALHALIETCDGLEHIGEICQALPAGSSVGLGETDLASDLGASSPEALAFARGRVVAAAAAHHLPPPSMSVFTNLRDAVGLRAHCRLGRRMGFVGQAAIHPGQLPAIIQEYSPTEDELAKARQVLESLGQASHAGENVVCLPDGTFLDPAMIRLAERTIALHDKHREVSSPA